MLVQNRSGNLDSRELNYFQRLMLSIMRAVSESIFKRIRQIYHVRIRKNSKGDIPGTASLSNSSRFPIRSR